MTMVDGKVANNLSDVGQSVCLICKATPSQMNNLNLLKRLQVDTSKIKYGLHTLHLWIRSLEYLLQLTYKMDVRKPSYTRLTQEEKDMNAARKQRIQKILWDELILRIVVDVPGGVGGNSNSGVVLPLAIFFKIQKKLQKLQAWI
eukprot:Pompholyxophrys_punicea_v1_NODE_766_length_1309_cov_13.700632.p2 type:complete len:145 gc:universal NODE_766_length_1309_cov_13.700632:548-982(+)